MIKVIDFLELSVEQRQEIIGPLDCNLKMIEKVFSCSLFEKEDGLYCNENNDNIIAFFNKLVELVKQREDGIEKNDIQKLADSFEVSNDDFSYFETPIGKTFTGKHIYPKTKNQKILFNTFQEKDMVFASGPAGCGKTFLSVVYAINCLKKDQIKKIIITRPVIEAGESLGYLPGDLEDKIDPYLIPIYDSLDAILSYETRIHLIEKGVIEIAPLAYMRGRTLDNAIVILDEAQNTTKMQMKMFLTRMGFNSKLIITGDTSQIDLKYSKNSGLIDALDRLKNIDEIGFVKLNSKDIVRHPLVRKVLAKYE